MLKRSITCGIEFPSIKLNDSLSSGHAITASFLNRVCFELKTKRCLKIIQSDDDDCGTFRQLEKT
jgi:hypothetical protein